MPIYFRFKPYTDRVHRLHDSHVIAWLRWINGTRVKR